MAEAMREEAIRLEGLGYRPGPGFAIQDLDLSVPSGSIYGFLGSNGSGKTTTIRLILDMLKRDAGRITVLGRDVPGQISEVLARVGYVPERLHLYPSLTVGETLAYHGAFFPTWDGAGARELVRQMGLDADQPVKRLSKGEAGKLMMILALSQRPELLILDEPTDGLDPVVRRDILTSLLEYVSETDATVFISSHLVHEVERFCDWVGVLDAGRLVAEMRVETFKNEIKRLRVAGMPGRAAVAVAGAGAAAVPGRSADRRDAGMADAPFTVLDRRTGPEYLHEETWIVRGWKEPMRSYFEAEGAELREVVDLDLEEGFVELLRAARPGRDAGPNLASRAGDAHRTTHEEF